MREPYMPTMYPMGGDYPNSAEIGPVETPCRDIEYSHKTRPLESANGEPTARSPYRVRSHAELEADLIGPLSAGEGLSCRMAMTRQANNELFPYSADKYGKQR